MKRVTAAIATTLVILASGVPAGAERKPGSDPPDFNPVQGPVLGFVFDGQAGMLRPVLGLPGGARLGTPLDFGIVFSEATPAPLHNYAIAVAAEDGRAVLVGTDRAPQPLNAPPRPDRVVFSPEGQSAALYYAASGRIVTVRVAQLPSINPALDATGLIGALTALAVSDDASTVLAATASDAAGYVYTVDGGGAVLIGSVRHASSAAFVPHSHTAVVADDGDNRIYILRGGAWAPLAGTEAGVKRPVAVAVSGDGGGRALVANGDSGTLLRIDLADGTVQPVDCGCTPAELERSTDPAVYRLTRISEGALLFLDDLEAQPRVFFVAGAASAQGGGQ